MIRGKFQIPTSKLQRRAKRQAPKLTPEFLPQRAQRGGGEAQRRRPKPYYADKWCTVYHGDLRAIVPGLALGEAVVITDPPYGETRFGWDCWPAGWPELFLGVARQMWVFGSMRLFWERVQEFGEWKLAQDVVWEKQNGSGLHNDRFRKVHELVVHVYRGEWRELYHDAQFTYDAQARRVRRQHKPSHWGQLSRPGWYEVEEGGPRLMRSVMYCKSMHRRGVHPTQKPEEIVRPLIEYSVAPGGLVVDPFAGSGTMLKAARDCGRRGIGIDVREECCEVMARRLSDGGNENF